MTPDLSLAGRYSAVRAFTLRLCEPLAPEDYVVQSMPDVSPTKWHLAHTSWFFETFLLGRDPAYRPYHEAYAVLFNSYYNGVGDQFPRPRRGLLSRPTVDEVRAYRHHVDERVTRRLETGLSDEEAAIVELGLHHEQQHQELLVTDIKHVLGQNPLAPSYGARPSDSAEAPPHAFVPFEGGLHEIGHPGEGFHFDNETPRHRVHLRDFALGSRLVTVGEYRAFMADDGYRRPELWLSEGWDWVQREEVTAPLYADDDLVAFTLAGRRRLHDGEPVAHVSLFEADAYARWAGARLPTEAEWEMVARDRDVGGNFVESGLLHPRPAPAAGLTQLFGDAWEWTQSSYAAYPGYRPPEGAIGEYNGKFMCNQYVLRGGSCASAQDHLRPTYRNFFPSSARWQFTSIRLANDLP